MCTIQISGNTGYSIQKIQLSTVKYTKKIHQSCFALSEVGIAANSTNGLLNWEIGKSGVWALTGNTKIV